MLGHTSTWGIPVSSKWTSRWTRGQTLAHIGNYLVVYVCHIELSGYGLPKLIRFIECSLTLNWKKLIASQTTKWKRRRYTCRTMSSMIVALFAIWLSWSESARNQTLNTVESKKKHIHQLSGERGWAPNFTADMLGSELQVLVFIHVHGIPG
jgi:hypothetical protein